jgi:hypothetical protein
MNAIIPITQKNAKKEQPNGLFFVLPGNVLLSQGRLPQLPSALRSLTSVFGMGTGVAFSP